MTDIQDTEITLLEYASTTRINNLLKSPFIERKVKNQLKKYLKTKATVPDMFIVKYHYSVKSINKTGRLVREGGQFPKEERWYIANGEYFDLDFRVCAPTILSQYYEMNDLKSPNLRSYCEDRDGIIQKKGVDKRFIDTVLNYKNFKSADKFFIDINADVYKKLIKPMKLDFPELWNHVKDLKGKDAKQNMEGTFVALVTQTYENRCLMAMHEFFIDKKREVGALIYDGLHLRKHTPDEILDEQLLRECEDYIYEQTGFHMTIVEKPMENSQNFLENVENYAPEHTVEEDERFDATYAMELYGKDEDLFCSYMNNFFVKITSEDSIWYCFREARDENYLIRSKKTTDEHFANFLVDYVSGKRETKKSIFQIWSKMTSMYTLKKIIFDPSFVGEDPLGEDLNLFRGFNAQSIPKEKIDYEIIQPIIDHISVLNNDETEPIEYTKNWLALLFQKPNQKNGTALVFNGDQGSGKSLLFDEFVGKKIIGKKKHYGYVKDIESLTQKFNSNNINKILTVGDEVTFGGGIRENAKLKSLITQDWQPYEKKSIDSVMMNDYCSYVFLSNGEWVVRVERSDRRFFVQRVKKIQSLEYYDKLLVAINHPEAPDHFYTYLMNIDISKFDPRKIPVTEEKTAMAEFTLDSFDHFCSELELGTIPSRPYRLAPDDEEESEDLGNGEIPKFEKKEAAEKYFTTIDHLFNEYNKFCDDQRDKSVHCKKSFGKQMRRRFDIENITSFRGNGCKVYLTI